MSQTISDERLEEIAKHFQYIGGPNHWEAAGALRELIKLRQAARNLPIIYEEVPRVPDDVWAHLKGVVLAQDALCGALPIKTEKEPKK